MTLFFVMLVFILLTGCITEENGYIGYYASDHYVVGDENIDAIDSPETKVVFTGAPVHRDNLHWSEGRDRDWEVDIRHFGVLVLRRHPLLVNYGDIEFVEGLASRYYSDLAHNALLERAAAKNEILVNDADSIREALREIIVDKTNELILGIPGFSNYEVKFSLSEIAAILDDVHTYSMFIWDFFERGGILPIHIRALYDGVYFTGVPREMERALYGELLAIGGIPIDEVIRRLGRVIPHENAYNLRETQVPRFLMITEMLKFIGVVCDSNVADFTIKDTAGEIFDVQVQSIEQATFRYMDDDVFVSRGMGLLMYERPGEDFWHEFLYDDNVMYVRISRFARTVVVDRAIAELRAELRNWSVEEKIEKLIIDLRGNPGGFPMWPTGIDYPFLSEMVESLYVIIDGGSLSQSVGTTSRLMHNMQHLTIVGEPTGQAENFFFGGALGSLPNSGMSYMVSRAMLVNSNSRDVAIRPDIFIPLTINDIINNRDPVLEFIVSR